MPPEKQFTTVEIYTNKGTELLTLNQLSVLADAGWFYEMVALLDSSRHKFKTQITEKQKFHPLKLLKHAW